METIQYNIKIWTNDGTNYGFSSLEEARAKLEEIKRGLKSNQKIEFYQEIIKREEIV